MKTRGCLTASRVFSYISCMLIAQVQRLSLSHVSSALLATVLLRLAH